MREGATLFERTCMGERGAHAPILGRSLRALAGVSGLVTKRANARVLEHFHRLIAPQPAERQPYDVSPRQGDGRLPVAFGSHVDDSGSLVVHETHYFL